MTDTGNPPPGYLPLPASSLREMSATPGWYAAGFRAWGLVITPADGLSMVAGTDADAAVWWMLNKAAACCGIHSGFSATPADSTYYMRGVGCDLALVRESPRHGANVAAGPALAAIGAHLGTQWYNMPIHGTVCLYLPDRHTDLDSALAMSPELVEDADAAARAAMADRGAGTSSV
jgi:hypothetical protein